MTIHVTPIPSTIEFGTPAQVYTTANDAGGAGTQTALRTDSEIAIFDATVPVTQAFGNSAATGVAAIAARRDHVHGMPALGPMTLIGTADASDSADLTVTGLSSAFDTYLIGITDCIPANDNVQIAFRVGDSAGIDSGASDYTFHQMGVDSYATTYAAQQANTASDITLSANSGVGNATGEGFGALLTINRPGDGSVQPIFGGTVVYIKSDGRVQGGILAGTRNAVIVLDRVNIRFLSGNITTGRLTVWGLPHA